jgi:hypothetical protein
MVLATSCAHAHPRRNTLGSTAQRGSHMCPARTCLALRARVSGLAVSVTCTRRELARSSCSTRARWTVRLRTAPGAARALTRRTVLDDLQCAGEPTALTAVALACANEDEPVTRLCVAAATFSEDSDVPESQLLLYDVVGADKDAAGRRLALVARVDVTGCVYALAGFDGYLAVARESSVRLCVCTRCGCPPDASRRSRSWRSRTRRSRARRPRTGSRRCQSGITTTS